ncbi:MAG: aminodeoxychorismate synthase component I [Candidatus Omnitrophica bacterium]|nr:aminodeoxychorismate synthase component I [Candidatus Omnitrophota bacterium]
MNHFPLHGLLKFLEKEKDYVFLDSSKLDKDNYLSFVFMRPQKIISTRRIDKVGECLESIDRLNKKGYYLAGFCSYEAGEAFEEKLKHKMDYGFPLLWFGVYRKPLIFDHRRSAFISGSKELMKQIKGLEKNKGFLKRRYSLKNIRASISRDFYRRAIAKIRDLIAQGFTYQVNYTFKLQFSFSGSVIGLYARLRNNQSVCYSALIHSGSWHVLSFSPELFFRKKGNRLLARPMKGTYSRGRTLAEDMRNAQLLNRCFKNRSENVMIVDLLRNDLGRISRAGSVKVPALFTVERYKTLLQMTSDIVGRLKKDIAPSSILRNIFPSGSVTGAPKIKTMQIIRSLEKGQRNVYTGSIGYFAPGGEGVFNVAIRTLVIERDKKHGEMGVGSGIVYDSDALAEYDECRLKARFLTESDKEFGLIETILWQRGKGYFLLDLHLRRLNESARYFDFNFRRKDIISILKRQERCFRAERYRIRLLLNKTGKVSLQASEIHDQPAESLRVRFAHKKVHSNDVFLYHKTTNRKAYDREYRKNRLLGYFDVLFENERGEVTEGAISNIVIKKGRHLYTPALKSGLLNGVYRQYLFKKEKRLIEEKVLFRKDVKEADEIYLINSVRGMLKVDLEDKDN